ncbi:xanthine dehydrogenase family protein molybdopterin-binding subunit [Roseomonas sp. HJA6]|uniref:Xanthine dehydrogenase family protein molybdopterin-binding subunit n=1 Tax=Roseomonas alba TaxID=2846776 RepID=A0ABS7A6P1_9PROT|nr:xanthine dehydrogenase family protein molybdopterin-binding subunit [Neoroseomonas alba]MBW6397974.1 xanthine dehydrogenase family protein molybdopterin-binding subunit [Neoroseomonas alba]
MSVPERGVSRRRLEDDRFLRGQGRYVDDLDAPGALHGWVLRSPHAHARILSIDTDAARAMPGVQAVLTIEDLEAEGIGSLPCVAKIASEAPLIIPPRPALADGAVRHVGDPVAFVVADSVSLARDAAEAIWVEYDTQDAVTDGAAALAADAPLLWPQAPGNLAFRFRKGDAAAVQAAMAKATTIVSLDLVNNRVTAAPMEPRAAVASYDAATGSFLLELSGQAVHPMRDQLADDIFHMPRDRIRLVAPDVGGGFGAKNFLFPEYVVQMVAARRLGRPVRWVAERMEDFVSTTHGRDNLTHARLGLDGEGRILALDVQTVANLGAYLSASGPGSSTNAPGTAMGGLYDIPAVHMDVRGAFTNTVPIDAYRGAGKPEANYIIERLIDLAARRIGRDPVALRRQNLIAGFPHRTAMGMSIDCGEFITNVDRALSAADADGFPARRADAARRGMLRGLGVACFLETSRGAPGEWGGVRFRADGGIDLATGTQNNGQGLATSFAQVAADLLGLPVETFRLVQADTALVPHGHGHGGARSMHMGGEALVRAIDAVIAKAKPLAAQLLQCAEADLDFTDGRFGTADGRGIGLLDVAQAAREAGGSIDAEVDSDLDLVTFPNGCQVAEVEVDPETGLVRLLRYTAVDDYGRLVNPMLTIGQVQGGLAQGIGQAMGEEIAYDPATGQILSASLMDYWLPRAEDLPPLDVTCIEVPTRSNRLGVKGSGQAGCIGAPQTVVNAVLDALAPLGIAAIDMPLTPARVWQAIRSAGP